MNARLKRDTCVLGGRPGRPAEGLLAVSITILIVDLCPAEGCGDGVVILIVDLFAGRERTRAG